MLRTARTIASRQRYTLYGLLSGLVVTAAPILVTRQVALRDQLAADIHA